MKKPNFELSELNPAEQHLFNYLKSEHNITLTHRGEITDFSLHGDEDEKEIEGYADDYASEIASDEAEYRATAQERYDAEHEWELVQQEKYETFLREI